MLGLMGETMNSGTSENVIGSAAHACPIGASASADGQSESRALEFHCFFLHRTVYIDCRITTVSGRAPTARAVIRYPVPVAAGAMPSFMLSPEGAPRLPTFSIT